MGIIARGQITIHIAEVGEGGTNIVEFTTHTRQFNMSLFNKYATIGHNENWVSVSNTSAIKVGDIGIINCMISDRDNIVGQFMSRRVADLLIKIGADSYEFQQKAKEVEKSLGGISKKLTDVGKNLSMKLSAPLMALGGVAVMAADGALKASAKVQQAIKSTAGAAKLSFEQLNAEADKLEGLTLFDGDDILNGATTQLLTFTNIAGENFKRTQSVALDLATVLQGDLKSASIQLGKALNDPVKNLSALSRSGIQFSKEQTAVIKQLAETGRLAEAQVIILGELERQYGGQAEAAAKVGAYSLNELRDAWGNLRMISIWL